MHVQHTAALFSILKFWDVVNEYFDKLVNFLTSLFCKFVAMNFLGFLGIIIYMSLTISTI